MGSFYSNFEWLHKNSTKLEKYAGKWIAIAKGKVIGFADTMKGLYSIQEVKEAKDPLITKIPLPEEAYSLL